MTTPAGATAKTIAGTRIATSIFFLMFGQYKVFGSGFAHGGFQKYLAGYIDSSAVSWYRPFLSLIVLPHAVLLGYAVGVLELFLGISLLFGLWIRPASALGAFYMLNLTLATWWDPGHGVPAWRYFGNELEHLPMLFLFVIFFASNAGQAWGLDGWVRK